MSLPPLREKTGTSTARSTSRLYCTLRLSTSGARCTPDAVVCVNGPRHARAFERQPRRRPGAQGEAPASWQRSCLGAPVRPAVRRWVGRIWTAAETRRGEPA